MSLLPSSEQFMANAIRDGTELDQETFHKFFESWLVEQDRYLQDLVSASQHYLNNRNGEDPYDHNHREEEEERNRIMRPLIDRVLQHYEQYYQAKSRWVKRDVMAMLSPCWRTTLEEAFLWIGGWRPTMACHLLYSKSGLQLEARFPELLRGISTGDLGDLSPAQLSRVDALQRKTIIAEQNITEKMAKQQETVADASMVELSHVVSEMMREGGDEEMAAEEEERVESALAHKKEGMEEILEKADDLRLSTLKEVIEILSPIQAVHFLIAAAELHLRLHQWGKMRDAAHHRQHHHDNPQ